MPILKRTLGAVLILGAVLGGLLFVNTAFKNKERSDFALAFENTSISKRRLVFEDFILKMAAGEMLEVLEEKYPLCHNQAHDLGRAVFDRTRDIAEAIQICRDGCTGACFHGVLMEAFSSDKQQETSDKNTSNKAYGDEHVWLDEVKDKAKALCDDEKVLSLHRKGKCVHGVGHAFAFLSEYEIPEALLACKVFDDRRLEFYCAGGVFMEYEGVYGARDLASESLHYPCDQYAEDFPAACYPHKTPHLLEKLRSREKMIEECLNLDGLYRVGCFNGLGYSYNLEVQENPRRVAQVCNSGSLDDQKVCLYGAIIKIAEINPEKGAEVCGFLVGEKKDFCEETFREGPYSLERDFSYFFSR